MLFIINIDPSKTLTLRNKFIADFNRRFNTLKRAVNRYVVEENSLGAITTNIIANFDYTYSSEKHQQFMDWIAEMEKEGILETLIRNIPYRTIPDEVPWMNTYLWSAYQKGLASGRMELIAQGVDVPSFAISDEFLFSAAFHMPIHSEAVGLLFTRAYNELKGITEAMNQQISRVLAQGMLEGRSPRQIARNITNRIESIGMVRARLLARTEIVKAYNDAKMNDYDAMEQSIVDEEIYVQWRTAGDERVRDPRHTSRNGKIYRKKDARRLVGEPNCRCALRPYLESTQGKITKKMWGPINPLEGR